MAIVISTLLIAALLNLLRARIQDFVDRHFFQPKCDAAQALAAFSRTARDKVDLDQLTTELLGVTQNTVQPEHASLWIRSWQTQRSVKSS